MAACSSASWHRARLLPWLGPMERIFVIPAALCAGKPSEKSFSDWDSLDVRGCRENGVAWPSFFQRGDFLLAVSRSLRVWRECRIKSGSRAMNCRQSSHHVGVTSGAAIFSPRCDGADRCCGDGFFHHRAFAPGFNGRGRLAIASQERASFFRRICAAGRGRDISQKFASSMHQTSLTRSRFTSR